MEYSLHCLLIYFWFTESLQSQSHTIRLRNIKLERREIPGPWAQKYKSSTSSKIKHISVWAFYNLSGLPAFLLVSRPLHEAGPRMLRGLPHAPIYHQHCSCGLFLLIVSIIIFIAWTLLLTNHMPICQINFFLVSYTPLQQTTFSRIKR